MARYSDAARPSVDLDLFWDGGISAALRSLEAAVRGDGGDHLVFMVYKDFSSTSSWLQTLDVETYLGESPFIDFKVDLATHTTMTRAPETVVPATSPIAVGLPLVPYLVYPIEDQIADKATVMIEGTRNPRTRLLARFRDLADLVLMLTTERGIQATSLRRALAAELRSRGLPVSGPIELPGPEWALGYENLVTSLKSVPLKTANEALKLVQRAIVPVLDKTAVGIWDPEVLEWRP